jgi:hypothetical protein
MGTGPGGPGAVDGWAGFVRSTFSPNLVLFKVSHPRIRAIKGFRLKRAWFALAPALLGQPASW